MLFKFLIRQLRLRICFQDTQIESSKNQDDENDVWVRFSLVVSDNDFYFYVNLIHYDHWTV